MAHFPEELLQLICDNLRPSGYNFRNDGAEKMLFRTLKNLCLANSTLKRIAQPVMVCNLNFEKGSWSRLVSVLQLVAGHAHLARSVRRIMITDWKTFEDEQYEVKQLPKDALDAILNAADGLDIWQTLRFKLKKDLASGSRDAQFALLLNLCIKLERIDARLPGTLDSFWVPRLIKESLQSSAISTRPVPFSSIRDVRLWLVPGSDGIQAADISHLLQLPSLMQFHCFCLTASQDRVLPAMSSTIRELWLSIPLMTSSELDSILSICPNVTFLDLEWEGPFTTLVRDYAGWGAVIRKHGTNFAKLFISVVERDKSRDGPSFGTLGNLSSLTGLETLSLPLESVYDTRATVDQQVPLGELLPTSLKRFNLWTDESDLEPKKIKSYIETQLSQLIQDDRFEILEVINLGQIPRTTVSWSSFGWKMARDQGWATLTKMS